MLQFGAGAPVQVASSSIAVDAPPIQANPHGSPSRVATVLSQASSRGVSVGACFPKFDPIEMYGVGRPLAQPNPTPMMQAPFHMPAINPTTRMPRRRGRRRPRRVTPTPAAPGRIGVTPGRPLGGVDWRCSAGSCKGTDAENLKTGDCVQGMRNRKLVCCCSSVIT